MVQHFNNLTPAQAERLAVLSEECGEVIQVVGKILRHGFDSTHPDGGRTNRQWLEKELGDVDFAKGLLCKKPNGGEPDLDRDAISQASVESPICYVNPSQRSAKNVHLAELLSLFAWSD